MIPAVATLAEVTSVAAATMAICFSRAFIVLSLSSAGTRKSVDAAAKMLPDFGVAPL